MQVHDEPIYEYEFGVCSRNINLKETEGNAFWELARKLDLEWKMKRVMTIHGLERIVIQGEMVGPGIQKNRYGLKEVDLYVYNVKYYTNEGIWEENQDGIERFCLDLNLKAVPRGQDTGCLTSSGWLTLAEHESALNPRVQREGIVVRHYDAGKKVFSFKAISNKYLLKHED